MIFICAKYDQKLCASTALVRTIIQTAFVDSFLQMIRAGGEEGRGCRKWKNGKIMYFMFLTGFGTFLVFLMRKIT